MHVAHGRVGFRGRLRLRALLSCVALATSASLVSGCGATPSGSAPSPDAAPEATTAEQGQVQIRDWVASQYGFAGEKLEGMYASTVTRGSGTSTSKTEFTFDAGSEPGAVFYGTYEKDGGEQLVCVYLSGDEKQGLGLYAATARIYAPDDIYSFDDDGGYLLSQPCAKSRCYVSLEGGTLTFVELAEKDAGWADGLYYLSGAQAAGAGAGSRRTYVETVRVMDLEQGFVDSARITRTFTASDAVTLECKVKIGDKTLVYASGFGSYTNSSAETLPTQQEFCDRANEALADEGVDWLTLTQTSWENRWYRLEVDESGIPDELAKVDLTCAAGVPSESRSEVTGTLSIAVNAESEARPQLEPEGPDDPVSYGGSTAPSQPTAAPDVPSNLPSSVSADELTQVSSASLDGYWYAPELDRFYLLNVSGARGKFTNSFSYCNLNEGDKVLQGTVKTASAYSVVLNANLDDEPDYEVFFVGGTKLVGDGLTLVRASSSIDAALVGTWESDDGSLEFEDDGSYDFNGGSWYWGKYFVTDSTHIAMGTESDDIELRSMELSGSTLTIEGVGTFSRR